MVNPLHSAPADPIERQPLIVSAEASVKSAIALMHEAGCAVLFIGDLRHINCGKQIIGIFTTNDLLRLIVRGIDLESTPIAAVMTPILITLKTGKSVNPNALSNPSSSDEMEWQAIENQNGGIPNAIRSESIHPLLPQDFPLKTAQPESEDRYRQLVEITSDWLWEIDAKGRYSYVSPKVREILGYEPAEIWGKTPFDLMPETEAKRVREIFTAIAAQRSPFSLLQNTNQHQNGSFVILETSGIPIFNAAGEFQGYRGIHREISARKNDELALQELNQDLERRLQQQTAELRALVAQLQDEISRRQTVESALRYSERQLESILNSLNDGVWSAIADTWEIVYLNPAIEKIYERSRHEFFHNANLWIEVVHPEDRDRAAASSQILFSTGSKDLKYRIVRPNGEVRWVEERAHLIYDGTGKAIRINGVARDITESKKANDAISRSERRFRAIFNQTFQFMVLLAPDGTIVEINSTALEFWGLSAGEAIGQRFWHCRCWQQSDRASDPQDSGGVEGGEGRTLSIAAQKLQTAIATAAAGKFWRDEVEMVGIDRSPAIVDISIEPVRDEDDRIIQLIVEGRDISDRKRLESEIIEREQLLNSFFSACSRVSLGLGILDEQMRFLQVNEALAEIHGVSPQEHLGKTPRDIIPHIAPKIDLLVRQLLDSGTPILNLEISGEIPSQPGVEHHWLACYFPVPLKNGLARDVGFILLDITKRKQAEQALRTLQERQEYLLRANPTIIYSCKPPEDCTFTFISENISRQFGYCAQELLDNPRLWIECIHPDDLPNLFANLHHLSDRDSDSYEYRVRHQNGSYRWVRDEKRLVRDREGNLLEIIGSIDDITEEKEAQQQLLESLQEKEVLLKEIHHRVKNNLQVISSLLNLQSRTLDDRCSRLPFQDSQNRIQSIAFIHEKLYQSRDLAQVDFCEYVETLSTHLSRCYGANVKFIKLNVKIDDIFLSVDTAIPCGLIVNELVSNALKHAFEGDRGGEIWIEMHSHTVGGGDGKNRELLLVVRDNGVGFPKEIDYRQTRSLGMQLVNTLVKQLKGKIELHQEGSTEFRIAFGVSDR